MISCWLLLINVINYRDGDCDADRNEETSAAEGDVKSVHGDDRKKVKEEPLSEPEGELTQEQDCNRKDVCLKKNRSGILLFVVVRTLLVAISKRIPLSS